MCYGPEFVATAILAWAEDQRVALLCYERNAAECHRALLYDALFADFARVDLEPALLT